MGVAPRDRLTNRFSDDSLFVCLQDIVAGNFELYFRYGNRTELRSKQGLTFIPTYRVNGTVNKGTLFNVSDYNAYQSTLIMHGFLEIDQMGPDDILLLINPTKLFN